MQITFYIYYSFLIWLNSWWIKIRDFLNEQFQTDEFTDVYKAMKVAKWAEKIETDANFVDWKNASMLAWTEKVKIDCIWNDCRV